MPRSDEANEAVREAARQTMLDAARRVIAKDGLATMGGGRAPAEPSLARASYRGS